MVVPHYKRTDVSQSIKLKVNNFCNHNEAKIREAEYSTILFQQGQFLSRVRPTKFKANIIAKIERYQIKSNVQFTFDLRSIHVRFPFDLILKRLIAA